MGEGLQIHGGWVDVGALANLNNWDVEALPSTLLCPKLDVILTTHIVCELVCQTPHNNLS